MSDAPHVRVATPADATVLADLNRNNQHENHRRVPEWFAAPGDPDVADLLRRWLCRDGAVGFLAEVKGELAGYALAVVHHRRATRVLRNWFELVRFRECIKPDKILPSVVFESQLSSTLCQDHICCQGEVNGAASRISRI